MNRFDASPRPFAKPYDPARAERGFEALAEAGYRPEGCSRALLCSTFGNSPFLARLAARDAAFLQAAMADEPEAILRSLCADALNAAGEETVASAMARLRRAKRRAALVVALADLGGLWDTMAVMRALSEFADACVRAALRFALREAAAQTTLAGTDPAELELQTGLVVLAMGKYGAFELNYSSDVDLVVFYDAEKFPFRKREDMRGAAVDIVKMVVKLLHETTADGYVFRVDLRLRPDAGATQIAISTEAAESYYEAMGQNWERAAMIKARVCAGDPQSGATFLRAMVPFIWRKNLDYAAIADIHSIKRQIHAHEGHGTVAVAGHNIKLGRGGIREIEFFAQTQQLILGGRHPDLRAPATLDALAALAARGFIAADTQADLRRSYLFLRTLEHRLQMVEDQQTHAIPKMQDGVAHIACFAGFEDAQSFSTALTGCLETVAGHYRRLFERERPLAAQGGSLVFTGVEDDPETLETLSNMGFRDAHHISAAIRGWHHGRVRATRGARARELLTVLVPPLLKALSDTADPGAAFAQFDRFLTRLPASVQFFSLLQANPHLLRLIAEIAGSAPRVATHLSHAPATLDALLDPDFMGALPSRDALDFALDEQLSAARDYEGALDAARRFAKEQNFRVCVQIVDGVAPSRDAGPAFANIAESVIAGLLPVAENELVRGFGRVPGGAFAILAMGKLGGREMTASSDLDLIFVYEASQECEASDGDRPLAIPAYYARLAQRCIGALTAQTAEGSLYEVDMRLRPSGNKGPVAVSLESFRRYHETEAWTWERMALTRARVIFSPVPLREKIEDIVHASLMMAMDEAKLFKDAREMRDKLAAQFPGKSPWDLKFTRGGLVDIEFIAQTFQLKAAPHAPGVLDPATASALEKLAVAGVLGADDASALIVAARLQAALLQVLRIAIEGPLDPQTASRGLKALLARAGEAEDFDALVEKLAATHRSVRGIFERLLPPV